MNIDLQTVHWIWVLGAFLTTCTFRAIRRSASSPPLMIYRYVHLLSLSQSGSEEMELANKVEREEEEEKRMNHLDTLFFLLLLFP